MTVAVGILALGIWLSLVMMAACWLAIAAGRSGWVDAIWSFAVGASGAVAAILQPDGGEPTTRQVLVAGLALLWSLRLGFHIASRNIRSPEDDPRYAQLKRDWGGHFRRRLFWFLQIQAAAAFVLVLSIAAAAHNPGSSLAAGDWLGIALMVVAVFGEAIADRQLAAFRADPANAGKVCDVGLWGVSRHPNYFFEWLGWLAYAAIAIDLSGGYPWGGAALAAPVLMYWLLVHVSGIPPLEAHMLRSRDERFRLYQARVNAFWPGPPRAVAGVRLREENSALAESPAPPRPN
jgi:steroid 5-alpha reductase family enzyme